MERLRLFPLVTLLAMAMISPIKAISFIENEATQNFSCINMTQVRGVYVIKSSHFPIYWDFKIPLEIRDAPNPLCLQPGPIGVAVDGVPLFSPLTEDGEVQENLDEVGDCDWRTDSEGTYHYKTIPRCLLNNTQHDQLLGVALDGFSIYGPTDENGRSLDSSDLDMCHGRVVNGTYRYHMTYDFPYILGCFRGEYTHPIIGVRGCVFFQPCTNEKNGEWIRGCGPPPGEVKEVDGGISFGGEIPCKFANVTSTWAELPEETTVNPTQFTTPSSSNIGPAISIIMLIFLTVSTLFIE